MFRQGSPIDGLPKGPPGKPCRKILKRELKRLIALRLGR